MSTNETIRWSEASPGKIDALVAEKVMGLKIEHWTDEKYKDADTSYCYVKGYVVINEPGSFSHWSSVPRYEQSMGEAWHVLRRVVDESKPLRHDMHSYDVLKLFCAALMGNAGEYERYNPYDLQLDIWQLAQLTPEMICKAALIAAGCEVIDE